MMCACGCGREAVWLISGVDYNPHHRPGGPIEMLDVFVDEPACGMAAMYCEEAAACLGLPFKKRLVDLAPL